MKRNKADPSIFLLAAIVLLFAAGSVFIYIFFHSNPEDEAFTGDRIINTLFVLEDQGKPLASYVLMHYPATRRAAIFDIPGEVGMIIQQINRVDRIDTVYNSKDIGPFSTEMGKLLGVQINFSLVINRENLGKIVDLLEGVDIFIPSPVEIFDETPPVLFPSGLIRMDGDKARLFVSYSQSGEEQELTVFRRQRFFLSLIKRLGEKNEELKNPALTRMFYPLFSSSTGQHVRTRLFDELADIDTDRTNIQSVGGNVREVSGQVLLFPFYDGSLIKEIVRQSLGSLTRQQEGSLDERVFTVEVLNGSGINGIAGRTAELLRSFGYDVISIGNADRSDYEKTEIIDRSGLEEVVKALGEVIRCENIRSEAIISDIPSATEMELNLQNFEYRSDFTLIIGRDFNGRYVSGG
ncbi:MAG: LCP family protein [Treponema sp.]|jgi:anionic cell wall polymer biosynthesis LytR-Cps2A-Psr (LCP) family protein|nr:LCP family protein [Treponema sp.]